MRTTWSRNTHSPNSRVTPNTSSRLTSERARVPMTATAGTTTNRWSHSVVTSEGLR
jgi:hypothetical protein